MTLSSPLSQPNLSLSLAGGESLDVREFVVEEGLSRLFDVRIVAVSRSADVDFESAIGQGARFEVRHTSSVDGDTRFWTGICATVEQLAVEDDGVSTYGVRVAPALWLLTQRRNYKVFQDKSELDIALEVLALWGIVPTLALEASSYEKRRYRTQYAETDFAFVSRLLEDIGVTYYFEQTGGASQLVLADAPNRGAARAPIPFVSNPNERLQKEYATRVRTTREVRPGRYTQSDVDFRKPLDYPLSASASKGGNIEGGLERYHHNYGSFLWKGQGGDTPYADDRGAARTNEALGAGQVAKRLDAQRSDARVCRFATTAYDIRPGQVVSIVNHPRSEVGAPQLVTGATFRGSATGEWQHDVETAFTDVDFRPKLSTPKPHTRGVESATVTGPAGEEIHCDEFGRIRLHFHWDREGSSDERSSCWVPVSQPWAGSGMGAISLPRVGQEVIVDFLGADPDRPVVVGSVFTTTMPPPYELPEFKMVSGLRSESYPRPKPAGAAPRMGGGPAALPQPAGGGLPATHLGGGQPAAATSGGTSGQSRRGPFGGARATAAALQQSAKKTRSQGPDKKDPTRSANGIVSNDRAGQEQLYLQAQKDMEVLVKDNMTGAVGSNRVFSIAGNDTLSVCGTQAINIGSDRTIEVGGKQSTSVQGEISVSTLENHLLTASKSITSIAKEGGHIIKSKNATVLRVGAEGASATVLMMPHAIVIDAPKVFINPGKDFTDALLSGASIDEAAKKVEALDASDAALERQIKDVQARIDAVASEFKGNDPREEKRLSRRLDPLFDQKRRLKGSDASRTTGDTVKIIELTTNTYRNLPDATWALGGPLTVVTGPAGAGSTGFLGAIALAAARLANIGGLPELDRVLRPGERSAKIRTTWALDEEECTYGGVQESVLVADTAFQRGGISGVEADPGLLGVMDRYDHRPTTSKVVTIPAVRSASAGVALFSDFEQEMRNHRLDPDAEKFSGLPRAVAALGYARGDRFETLQSLLEQLVPWLSLSGMSPGGQPEFFVRGSMPLPLSRLSFAEKSAFVLASAVTMMGLARSVILLDTPELGLPPGLAGPWVDALRSATPEAQWVVASRDPEVVARADRASCIVLQGGSA